MIPVAQALEKIFALLAPLAAEEIPLRQAAGRVLAEPVAARRDQPPFPASSMDGHALRSADIASGAALRIVGESRAGQRYGAALAPGEAVAISTGGPVPDGADQVVPFEESTAAEGWLTVRASPAPGQHIRPAGGDFRAGDRLEAPRRLTPADVALLAAMGRGTVRVTRPAEVAVLSTGDELVPPGEPPGDDQITASNGIGLSALVESEGARARLLPIARDTRESLADCLALTAGADLVVTSGGASVGPHDLMARAGAELGLERRLHKVAMRPGKPLMAGRVAGIPLIGLPGNPVSAMVCGEIFLRPALRVLAGLPAAPRRRRSARLAADLPANGPREHYMRAVETKAGLRTADSQDSALLSVLAAADGLIVRPAHDPARAAGETVEFVPLARD